MADTASIILSSATNSSTRPHTVAKRFAIPYTSSRDKLALASLTMPYSIPNVSVTLRNTGGFQYRWVDGVVYDVVYPGGSYSVSDLQFFAENVMANNGHYLLKDGSVKQFFLEFRTNQIYYSVTLTVSAVPTVLAANQTNPNSIPLNGKVPQVIIAPEPNTWGRLLGYEAGSYPPTLSTLPQQYNGTLAPVISPIVAINVLCNWIFDDRFSDRPSVLASFVPTGQFGETIQYQPQNLVFLNIVSKQYYEIEVTFVDQDFQPIEFYDRNQIQISLLLQSN